MKTRYKNRRVKTFQNSIKLLSLFALINLIGCSDDDGCAYDSNTSLCTFSKTNTKLSGWSVATCYAGTASNPIGVIYDTSLNSSAVPGDDWGAILGPVFPISPKAIHPPSWTAANIGQVFGIAIDDSENIFLATSGIYNQSSGYNYDNGVKSATIYKSSSPSWSATPFISLPTSTGNFNDIGNIAYDKRNNQLFATNLENGIIYRITGLNGSLGTVVDVYDPWSQDPLPSAPGIVSQDEQVWGIGVNYEGGNTKVYFPRVTSAGAREIYSITLNNDGSFPVTASEVVEISAVPGTQNVISDFAFSSDTNEMLLSERGNPHASKVFSYSRTSAWNFNKQYFVGANAGADGENSAGGVDFAYKELNGDISADCDNFFWASGNYMDASNISGKVYGLEGISYSGNNSSTAVSPTANKDTDLFIDLNGSYSTGDKLGIGDVEVFDANSCFIDICSQ
ncbi:hypothetical protein [Polaribacter sp. 11A2H]|uniref:hypothetical protein n=1 Tax=Polaribacter sp. 11A2H TaxID=2687290 RepID=UPI00140D13F6|nr:hypothetical protein [Polaribacter sp. 11A2H]